MLQSTVQRESTVSNGTTMTDSIIVVSVMQRSFVMSSSSGDLTLVEFGECVRQLALVS
jgi:hypothetical protein